MRVPRLVTVSSQQRRREVTQMRYESPAIERRESIEARLCDKFPDLPGSEGGDSYGPSPS